MTHTSLHPGCRIVLLCLLFSLTLGALAACNAPLPEGDTETTSADSQPVEETTSGQECSTMEETSMTTEDITTTEETASVEETTTAAEETTEAVTDVMIGETLDAEYAADFAVSNVFSNDMVVQRNEHIRVWGTAPDSENGKKISGEFKGMFAEALIEDGKWTLTFGARMEASAELGHTMRLYTDTKSVEFSDVLVGDVYMVIGQSNVNYSLQTHWKYNPANGTADTIDENAPIRLHYNSLNQMNGYPQRGTEEVCDELRNGETWQRATLSTISRFSAIGYFFAAHYVDITDATVPVGMIEIDGNGQPLGAFLPNEVADAFSADHYDEEKGYYVPTGVNAIWGRYMYNHYMVPFEQYAIAGVLWYQGESDCQLENAKTFAQKFSAMMTYMRSTHNLVNKDFPVFMVEFPTNFNQHPDFVPSETETHWSAMDVGLIRAVLSTIPRMLPNSYLSVSVDLWTDETFFNSLHPNCKYEQGERLAKLASAVQGISNMGEAAGPVLVDVQISADKKTAVLTYDNVGTGLTTTDGGTAVRGYTLINSDYFVREAPAGKLTATITAPNQVTLVSAVPVEGIAYNAIYWYEYDVHVNLCNSYGVPAGATLMLG